MGTISRRIFLKVVGAAAATLPAATESATTHAVTEPAARPQAPTRVPRASYTFFNRQESEFIEAATARLIPSDSIGPGALEAGVADYIDKQLGGAWGAGERLYRQGPWHAGLPTQGYQLPFTPAELFRNALRAVNADVEKRHRTTFAKLAAVDQDAYLSALERSQEEFNGVPGAVFFASLLEMTIEGFFCDPVYGGNRDMVGWKLIGFPGAYASYYAYVDQHNLLFRKPPVSLAEDAHGHVHVDPRKPAYVPLPHRRSAQKGN